jgi:hypothetical protein
MVLNKKHFKAETELAFGVPPATDPSTRPIRLPVRQAQGFATEGLGWLPRLPKDNGGEEGTAARRAAATGGTVARRLMATD